MTLNRRQFITTSAMAGTGLMLNTLNSFARPLTQQTKAGYSLLVFATNWGFGGSWDEFCSKIKAAGYDGCEVWWPGNTPERTALFNALKKFNLKVGFLCGSGQSDFTKHEAEFRKSVTEAVSTQPAYINCHSGKDYFTPEQKEKLIAYTIEASRQGEVPIYHETHRGRALYAAPVTDELMRKIPGLRLTLDISHWCTVHESYLNDQEEAVNLALSRTDHIHARIGHPEGPQVNDPRAPEWDAAVNAHFAWWDNVVAAKKQSGSRMTFLTEFGPPDYMPTLPYTRQPLASQWDINVYMMEILRKRYS
ncbi:MAG: sugar phosphate isomerase/epimerase [Cyclobacteriaceae bacterium]|nr:sugar phosphate isomerase/epimerase [Cyclobacteriaceae bacterium]